MMYISEVCLLQQLMRKKQFSMEDKAALIWEGNYYDGMCHDYAELSWKTISIVVAKTTKLLNKYCQQNDYILLLLPNIVQLPLIILAADCLQLIPILVNPSDIRMEKTLNEIFSTKKIKLIITLDGYWQADHLHRTKENLDQILQKTKYEINHVLVIRHCAPNDGIPTPDVEYPGRRPSYQLKFSLMDGRDEEWSQLFRQISGSNEEVLDFLKNLNGFNGIDKLNCSSEAQSINRISIILPVWYKTSFKLQFITINDLFQALERITKRIKVTNESIILNLGHPAESFYNFITLLFPWYSGNALVQFEGHFSFPDPSRISHIIQKYHVDILLLSHDISLDPNYLSIVPTPTLQYILVGNASNHIEHGVDVKQDAEDRDDFSANDDVYQMQLQVQILQSVYDNTNIETINM